MQSDRKEHITMKLTNRYNLPEPLVRAIKNDDYDKGESDFSITGLLSPPQKNYLTEKHWEEMEEDASDRIWSLLGTSVHNMLEKGLGEGSRGEERLFAEIGGSVISGKFDHLDIKNKTLSDYKCTSAYAVKGELKPEWEKQLNYYKQLCQINDIEIDKLQIVAILRDWSKMQMMRSPDYPRANVVVLDIPMWQDEVTLEDMRHAVTEQLEAREGNYRPCTDGERWKSDNVYAVMKAKRKSALRLLSTRADAEKYCFDNELIDGEAGITIEFREGVAKRCLDYCSAAPYCEQFKEQT